MELKYRRYELKSTHTAVPYIRVGNGYLDATTETTDSVQLKIRNGTDVLRPKQTYTTTAIRTSEYTKATGYEI